MPPKGKNTEIWLPDLDFFQGLEMERKPPQQFSGIFGDVLDPPSHSEHQKKFLVRLHNFLKMAPEVPWFRCRGTRKRVRGTRFRVPKNAWYF